jgi:hypothetical protein
MKAGDAGRTLGLLFFAIACSVAVISSPVQAALISAFNNDNDTEGWTTTDSTVDITWVSGGYVEESDNPPQNRVWYFVSPDTWDGDWRGYIGGTLQYDMRFWIPSGSQTLYGIGTEDTVRIYRGGDYAAWVSDYEPTGTGMGHWDTLEFQLSPTSYSYITGGYSLDYIMANVTALYIRGDWWTKGDRTGLDNVVLNTGGAPIPSTVVLLGIGLVGLVALRRQSKN